MWYVLIYWYLATCGYKFHSAAGANLVLWVQVCAPCSVFPISAIVALEEDLITLSVTKYKGTTGLFCDE